MIEQLNLLIVPPPSSSGRKLLRCRYVERRRFQSKVCRIGYFINQCRLERRPRIEGSYSHAKQSNHASHSSKGREQTGPTLVRIPKTAGHRIGRDSTRQPSNRGSEILMRLRRRERGGGRGGLWCSPIGGSRYNTFDSGILGTFTRGRFL